MNVVILMGGNSKERQVSLQSGNAIFEACKHLGYNTSVLDMTKDIDFYLNELKKYDLVFIGLHGGEGENGTIQKTLEQNEIIFTGNNKACSKKPNSNSRNRSSPDCEKISAILPCLDSIN